jgi:GNAT superfamily N-acetyltransferase
MIHRGSYAFSSLNIFTAIHYTSLTHPRHRALLESFNPSDVFAIGVSAGGEPIGLALATTRGADVATILSVYVARDFRNRGIGTELLRVLERNLADCGFNHGELSYACSEPSTPIVERFLSKCGWSSDGERMFAFIESAEILLSAWSREAVLPDSYSIAPWLSITPEERETLRQSQENERWIPENLNPFRFEKGLEPSTSLILRRGENVVGWLLTHRLDSSTLEYANLFVRPSLNRVGNTFASLALLSEGVRRTVESMGKETRGQFCVAATNKAFLRFIERHMSPHLLSKVEIKRLVKPL